MRGARRSGLRCLIAVRIIPADAGSTCLSAGVTTSGWDHPRGCGEHSSLWPFLSLQAGSSPRMRGAQGNGNFDFHSIRIIPADAGSTITIPVPPTVNTDHPRGCGEHT